MATSKDVTKEGCVMELVDEVPMQGSIKGAQDGEGSSIPAPKVDFELNLNYPETLEK